MPIIIGTAFGAFNGYMIGNSLGATGWNMFGYVAGGALIGGLSGGVSLGLSTAGAGTFIAGAAGRAVGGAGFSGLATGWNRDAMLRGALSGAIAGGIGASVNSIFNYESVGLINGMLEGGAYGAVSGFVSGGLTNVILGGDFMEGALNGMVNGAMMGLIYGGISGMNNANTLGVNKFTGGTLDERAQAWADYFGMEGFKASALTNDNIDHLNRTSTKYTFEQNGSTVYATELATGEIYEIDGYFHNSDEGAFLTKSVIRHMRFDGAWAKGTMYHEYTHFKGESEQAAYKQGLIQGGRSYYKHCGKKTFPHKYKYYRNIYGL